MSPSRSSLTAGYQIGEYIISTIQGISKQTFSGKGTTRGFATTSPSGVGEEERESLTLFVGLAPSGCSVALRLVSA